MTIQEKMRFMHENPVVSWHEHVWLKEGTRELETEYVDFSIRTMDTLGIDKSVVSCPVFADRHCPPEKFIAANNAVYEATRRHPGRFYGMAFVNPAYHDAMLRELERCVYELGFVGVKLYHHYFMDDPVQYSLVEKCIDLDIPVLMHCAHCMDPVSRLQFPRTSDGAHMANIARRYPEGTFLMGHIGGGGDWQWAVKAIADCKNVYADISGSVCERPQIEEAIQYLGAERMLFATDMTWTTGVAKILGADISDEDKKMILAGTAFRRFLEKAGE